MKKIILAITVSIPLLPTFSVRADVQSTARAKKFLTQYTAKIRPLEIAVNRAWWDANLTGKDAAFKRMEDAQNRINAVLADKSDFKEVAYLKKAAIDDPVIKRAIDVIYLAYLEKQVDTKLLEKMTALSSKVEKKWSTYRPKLDGKELTAADIRKVLKSSTLSVRRKAVWEASKSVGKVVEKELLQLVKLRNQAARSLKFPNYHELKLYINEQNGKDLIKLFDELDELTREPFVKAKREIDVQLAKNVNVKPSELMPWHYHDPFFQETPNVFSYDIDQIWEKNDIVRTCREFYQSIGLPIDLVIQKSNNDFAPRKGKNPHAFCTDITRDGTDVRVLANVVPNDYWATTMLHEFGHSVYSSIYMPAKLPYVLRQDAHILCTEGVAMLFEKFARKRAWLSQMGIEVKEKKAFDETASKLSRYQLLIFSRWCQVMLRFEKKMYENPDQDLNKLWWDMVERYQMLKRPPGRNEPDYGSKIHVIAAPVYYHNYMMGEMFASQLHHAVARIVYMGKNPNQVTYVGDRKVGEFFKERVFHPGRTLSWNELTRFATGSPLSAKAFAQDFKAGK